MATRRLLFQKLLTSDDLRRRDLLIPPGEGREYFQQFPQDKAIPFWGECERQWIFSYNFYRFKGRKFYALSGEWHKFVEAKNLQEADTLADTVSIELVHMHGDGEIPGEIRFYVHVFRGVPAGIQPLWAKALLLPFTGAVGLVEMLRRTVKAAANVVEALFGALVLKRGAVAARLLRGERNEAGESSSEDSQSEPEDLHGKESSRDATILSPSTESGASLRASETEDSESRACESGDSQSGDSESGGSGPGGSGPGVRESRGLECGKVDNRVIAESSGRGRSSSIVSGIPLPQEDSESGETYKTQRGDILQDAEGSVTETADHLDSTSEYGGPSASDISPEISSEVSHTSKSSERGGLECGKVDNRGIAESSDRGRSSDSMLGIVSRIPLPQEDHEEGSESGESYKTQRSDLLQDAEGSDTEAADHLDFTSEYGGSSTSDNLPETSSEVSHTSKSSDSGESYHTQSHDLESLEEFFSTQGGSEIEPEA